MDLTLLELHRRVRTAPGDPGEMLRLAHGLVRAGRRPEAIAALDPKALDEDAFLAVKALRERLWRDELSELRLVATVKLPNYFFALKITIDPRGRWISCKNERSLLVLDFQGRTLHEEWFELRTLSFDLCDGIYLHTACGIPANHLEWNGSGFTKRPLELDLADGGCLFEVSPAGDRFFLLTPAGRHVIRWPGRTVERETSSWTGLPWIDWDTGTVLGKSEGRRWETLDIASGAVRRLAFSLGADGSWRDRDSLVIGPGLVARQRPGLKVFDHVNDRIWTLVDDRSKHALPSLSSDGRTIRYLDGRRANVQRFDRERTKLTKVLDPGFGLPWSGDYRARWHPHADVFHGTGLRRGPGIHAVDGTILCEQPRSLDCGQWSADGRVFVGRRQEGFDGWLELWQTS